MADADDGADGQTEVAGDGTSGGEHGGVALHQQMKAQELMREKTIRDMHTNKFMDMKGLGLGQGQSRKK